MSINGIITTESTMANDEKWRFQEFRLRDLFIQEFARIGSSCIAKKIPTLAIVDSGPQVYMRN